MLCCFVWFLRGKLVSRMLPFAFAILFAVSFYFLKCVRRENCLYQFHHLHVATYFPFSFFFDRPSFTIQSNTNCEDALPWLCIFVYRKVLMPKAPSSQFPFSFKTHSTNWALPKHTKPSTCFR